MLFFSKDKKENRVKADALYTAILAQSRQPYFYTGQSVPDTFNGRFEMVLLHAFLVWDRLSAEGLAGARLSQALFDAMFRDMSQSLRQVGIGDLGVPHHVKRMMKAFKGRSLAYREGLTGGPGVLEEALRRNLFGTLPGVEGAVLRWFASYIRQQKDNLAAQDLTGGVVVFEERTHDLARMVS